MNNLTSSFGSTQGLDLMQILFELRVISQSNPSFLNSSYILSAASMYESLYLISISVASFTEFN